MAEQGLTAVLERLDGLAAEINVLAQAMRVVISNQTTTADLVARVLEAVSRKSDGDTLGELLAELVMSGRRHTEMLENIQARVLGA